MNLGTNIKLLRRQLNLTQTQFANKIGLKQAVMGQMEKGTRSVTDRNISLICKEFNVNENWLRTGKGEMFNPKTINEIDILAERYDLPPLAKKLVEMFVTLEEKEMDLVIKKIKEFALQAVDENEISATEENIEQEFEEAEPTLTAEDEAELESYKDYLLAQKRAKRLSAYRSTNLKGIS